MKIASRLVELDYLRHRMIYNMESGLYKEYVASRKDYAMKFVQCPEAAAQLQPLLSVSILSPEFWNTFKIKFIDMFRRKTPEEKEMMRIAPEIKAKKAAGYYA